MQRLIIALSAAAAVASAVPVFAGPNNGETFPLYQRDIKRTEAPAEPKPHALLGDTSDETAGAPRTDLRAPRTALPFQRRPSEGK